MISLEVVSTELPVTAHGSATSYYRVSIQYVAIEVRQSHCGTLFLLCIGFR